MNRDRLLELSQNVLLLVPRAAWDAADPRPTGPHLDGIQELWADEDLGHWSSVLEQVFGASRGHANDPQTIVWGEPTGTCLEIAVFDGLVEELRVRVDLARGDAGFLERLIGVARAHGLVFVTMQGTVIEPVPDRVIEAVPASVVPREVVNDDFPEDDLDEDE